jgi:hypothetical protein
VSKINDIIFLIFEAQNRKLAMLNEDLPGGAPQQRKSEKE